MSTSPIIQRLLAKAQRTDLPSFKPGDTVRVWFPGHIRAVKGYWSGTPTAEMAAGGSGPVSAPATASKDTWGEYISGKNVSNTNTPLWADVIAHLG